jgi:hypothetical protein
MDVPLLVNAWMTSGPVRTRFYETARALRPETGSGGGGSSRVARFALVLARDAVFLALPLALDAVFCTLPLALDAVFVVPLARVVVPFALPLPRWSFP